MSKTMISVKVDKEAKQKAQAVAKAMGLSLSALINSHLHQVARTKRLVLDLDIRPEPRTAKTAKLIEEFEKDIVSDEVSDSFETVDEFLADLKQ